MAITRKRKETILNGLVEKFKKAKLLILLDYKGIGAEEAGRIRKELRKGKIDYLVAKKTLIHKALIKSGINGFNLRELKNQVAVVSSNEADPLAAKIIKEFQKQTKKTNFLKGVLEGKIIEKEELNSLAMISSREDLLGKVVGSLFSPVSGFVYALKGNLNKLVLVLSEINKKKS